MPIFCLALTWASLVRTVIAAMSSCVQWFCWVQKTRFTYISLLSLALTIFNSPLLWKFLRLRGVWHKYHFSGWPFHSLTLCILTSYRPVFVTVYCRKKLLWWRLRGPPIFRHRGESLGYSLFKYVHLAEFSECILPGAYNCLDTSFLPLQWCQVWIPSCESGLKSNQNVISDPFHATVAPVGTSGQGSHCCSS